MAIQYISAVTLAVQSMERSVVFYEKAGLTLSYGSKDSSFSTFKTGEGFLNLILTNAFTPCWWGRIIFRVQDADELYDAFRGKGLNPDEPRNGGWGERYFHLLDPDGHELSFAELL